MIRLPEFRRLRFCFLLVVIFLLNFFGLPFSRYCKCEMPCNPDDLMVQCEGCKDWFHPACMVMTIEEAKKLDNFLCSDCVAQVDSKKGGNSFSVSPLADVTNENKRRKR